MQKNSVGKHGRSMKESVVAFYCYFEIAPNERLVVYDSDQQSRFSANHNTQIYSIMVYLACWLITLRAFYSNCSYMSFNFKFLSFSFQRDNVSSVVRRKIESLNFTEELTKSRVPDRVSNTEQQKRKRKERKITFSIHSYAKEPVFVAKL